MRRLILLNKAIIFVLGLLLSYASAFASSDHEQNISISYGYFNLNAMTIVSGNIISHAFDKDFEDEEVDFITASSFNIAYGFEVGKLLETGGFLTYAYAANDINMHTISLMPKAKFNWVNKTDFRCYSQLAFGVATIFDSDTFDVEAVFHISLIGFEFGLDTSFFFELGAGQVGSFSAGVKFSL